jgi:ABC-type glutathione transport system ATPase component
VLPAPPCAGARAFTFASPSPSRPRPLRYDVPLMPPVLEARGLRKSFGSITAVSDVSFAVGAGELVGLLGPNGAGKSTTVGMIVGIVAPDAG